MSLEALFLTVLMLAPPPVVETAIERQSAGAPITIARGDTRIIEVRATLPEPPDGEASARVITLSQNTGLFLVRWVEELKLDPARRGKVVLRAQVFLRAAHDAAIGEVHLSGRIELYERKEIAIGVVPIEWDVTIAAATPTAGNITRDRDAFLHHQRRAREGLRLVPLLGNKLRLDRVERPRDADSLPNDQALALRAFLYDRLRAQAAFDRLRAAASVSDPALVEAALRAIGATFAPLPRGAPKAQKPIATAQLLGRAERQFAALELEQAQTTLLVLRFSPAIDRATLARSLLLLGGISAAQGLEEQTRTDFGQALCLDPTLKAPDPRPPISRFFAEILARKRCTVPLDVHSAIASRRDGQVVVQGLFGPDPYHLIDRGEVELLGPDGKTVVMRSANADRGDLATIAGVFAEGELPASSDGKTRARITARDVAGLPIAIAGSPEPVVLAVEEGKSFDQGGVPWWLWAIGGAVVAGGATALIVIANDRDPVPAIGPVSVTF